MNKVLCILAAAYLPLISMAGGQAQVSDSAKVAQFTRNAKLCEHFAGEWDPDMSKKEKRAIEGQVDKYCSLAQRQRTKLMSTFKNNTGVLQTLNQYDAVNNYSPSK